MNSLIKTIIENQEWEDRRNGRGGCDELGIPLENEWGDKAVKKVAYYVTRALLLDAARPDFDPEGTNRLHLREGEVYRGKQRFLETREEFYRLTAVDWSVREVIWLRFWSELKRYLPQLSTDYLKVVDGVFWDRRNGELIKADYKTLTTKNEEKEENGA